MKALALAIAATLLCTFPVNAETYVRAVGGTPFDWSYEHNEFTLETRNGYYFAGAVGSEVGKAGPFKLAVEGEISYLRSPIDNTEQASSLSSLGVYANTVLRLDLGGIEPYVAGGMGLAVNAFQLEDRDIGSQADPGLAWQAIAGTSFSFTERIKLDVQYRYLGQDFVSVGDKILNDHFQAPRQHVAAAGLTFVF